MSRISLGPKPIGPRATPSSKRPTIGRSTMPLARPKPTLEEVAKIRRTACSLSLRKKDHRSVRQTCIRARGLYLTMIMSVPIPRKRKELIFLEKRQLDFKTVGRNPPPWEPNRLILTSFSSLYPTSLALISEMGTIKASTTVTKGSRTLAKVQVARLRIFRRCIIRKLIRPILNFMLMNRLELCKKTK